jgi:ATP phosphoribosyltransferase regulatory subunit HisZ
MGVYKLSISALVENIITEHLQKYESQISQIQQEEQERLYPTQDEV